MCCKALREDAAAPRHATARRPGRGGGPRCTETAKLNLTDWSRKPAAAEFSRYGMLHARYGTGGARPAAAAPNVSSMMGWAVEAVVDYVDNIRPRFGIADHRRCG